MIKITVWNENYASQETDAVRKAYPDGMNKQIATFLKAENFTVRTAYLDQPDNGLPPEVLENTDVLVWWGHCKHGSVSDEVARKIADRVHRGMGAIFLHSAHFAKPFKALMGTSCTLQWRVADEKEIVWVAAPSHPISDGIDGHFVIEKEEMYGEPYDIPAPDEVVFIGWFKGGNVFRSGVTYRRGRGKVFYFQPGHETYPVYFNAGVQRAIANAVKWAAPDNVADTLTCPNAKPLEQI